MLTWIIKPWANAGALDETWTCATTVLHGAQRENMRVCCVRWGVLSSLPVAFTTFADVCMRNVQCKNRLTGKEICKKWFGDWGSQYSFVPFLPSMPLMSFLPLMSFFPLLGFFPLLRVPPCRWRWRRRRRLCSTGMTPLLAFFSKLWAKLLVNESLSESSTWSNIRVSSSLLVSHRSTWFYCFFRIFVNWHLTSVLWVFPSQYKLIFVSRSLRVPL